MNVDSKFQPTLRLAYLVLGLALLITASACERQVVMSPDRISRLGESCTATNECASGLICIMNQCVQREYPISLTANVCVFNECSSHNDCPSYYSEEGACSMLDYECDQGDADACHQYDLQCITDYACQRGSCVPLGPLCNSARDCEGIPSLPHCVSSECVECEVNAHCEDGESCRFNTCVPNCESNFDCPFFNACVEGECRETGCTSDRECISYLDNALAICVEGECELRCNSDRDCSQEAPYNFHICSQGRCEYVGCESDLECEMQASPADERFSPGARNESLRCIPWEEADQL